jgi:succinate dehydrogenase / fumarate reductase cytochrome b subunit
MSATITEEPLAPRGTFVRSRLGSLLAVVPLSVWAIDHLWNNLAAFRGAAAWQAAVTEYEHPLAMLLTFAVVLLPLLLHTIWGVGRLLSARPNNAHYGFYGNLKYLLQRLSALGVLLFLGAHIWLAFLRPRYVEGRPEPFADIAGEMRHHLPTLLVYVLGTLGVSYHLANGLQTACMGWGVVTSRHALAKLDRAALVVFAALLATSWSIVYALWSAGG